jgi:hypothetical protein
MKKVLLISSLVLLVLIILFMVLYSSYLKKLDSKKSPDLIGGQKDIHGCLIAAGYSWCELKEKCLRTWEEPCEVQPTPAISNNITYSNEKYNFELQLPKIWEGYLSSEADYPDYSSVSFSFKDSHQPFSIFSLLNFTSEQWENIENPEVFKILLDTGNSVLVCDGCCGINNDYNGGGQFDEFQVARCKEGTEIMSSFKTINK